MEFLLEAECFTRVVLDDGEEVVEDSFGSTSFFPLAGMFVGRGGASFAFLPHGGGDCCVIVVLLCCCWIE